MFRRAVQDRCSMKSRCSKFIDDVKPEPIPSECVRCTEKTDWMIRQILAKIG